jgi:hypothetical protein
MSLDITKLRSADNIQESGNLVVYDSGADTLATVMAAGYFNDADKHLNVDDTIRVTHPNGVSDLSVSSITAGVVVVNGGQSGEQVIAAAGAIDVLNPITLVESVGAAQAMTLADGLYIGQRKIIAQDTGATSSVITPATSVITNITLSGVGDSCELMWTTSGWVILGLGGIIKPVVT